MNSENTTIITQNEISRDVQIATYIIIGIISFLTNSLIFLVLGLNRNLHTKTNFLLVSLALTDWLIIVVGIPLHVINLTSKRMLRKDTSNCKTGFLILIPFLVSNFNLTLIALHRYILIVKNRLYKKLFTNRNTIIAVVAIWLLAILLSITPFFGWGAYKFNENRSHCMIHWSGSQSYLYFIQIIAFPIPLGIMTFSYYKVISHSNASRKRLKASADRHNLSKQTQELRLTFMLLIILLIFFALFLPYAILIYLEGIFNVVPSHTYSFISIVLCYSNSMFDFWIYAAMSAKFRKAFLTLIQRLVRRRSHLRIYPSDITSSSHKVDDDLDSHVKSITPELSKRRRSVMNIGKSMNKNMTPFYKTENFREEYDIVSDVYIGTKPRMAIVKPAIDKPLNIVEL